MGDHPVGHCLSFLNMPKKARIIKRQHLAFNTVVASLLLPEVYVTNSSGPQRCLEYGLIQQRIDETRLAYVVPTDHCDAETISKWRTLETVITRH